MEAVRRILAKLLLLLSVLLMPLGMGAAVASAPVNDHSTMMAGALEHCPDQSNQHPQHGGVGTCSMACASALPAQDQARDDPPLRVHQLLRPLATRTLRGIRPQLSTPPPKLA